MNSSKYSLLVLLISISVVLAIGAIIYDYAQDQVDNVQDKVSTRNAQINQLMEDL